MLTEASDCGLAKVSTGMDGDEQTSRVVWHTLVDTQTKTANTIGTFARKVSKVLAFPSGNAAPASLAMAA